MTATSVPYGSWVSPITSDMVVNGSLSLMEVKVDPWQTDTVFWSEMRPEEDGRYVVCSWTEGRKGFQSLTPEKFSCRTRVHEYGGGAFFVHNYCIYFSNFEDQRLYCQNARSPGSELMLLTPEGKDLRYADGTMYKEDLIVCVREDHDVIIEGAEEAQNTLVSINCKNKKQFVLVSGADFYSTPRVSQTGTLAWVQWNHPNMPWDSTELWVGELCDDGQSLKDGTQRKVAGGDEISVMLPKWSPDDTLMYIHDQSNWWNLYRLDDDQETNLCPTENEIGEPAWEFGGSPYSCNPVGNGDILVIFGSTLACLKSSGEKQEIKLDKDYTSLSAMHYAPDGKYAYMEVASPSVLPKLIKVEVNSGKTLVIRESLTADIGTKYYSIPAEVSWISTNGTKVYAYYYPPQNKDYQGSEGELPPLLVKAHGGCSSWSPCLDLKTQFFTSRGFAILDVNYRGSSGFGRKYRNALKANIGVIDIEDCCAGAQAMVNQGKAHPTKLIIKGRCAGGFIALGAITFHKVFHAATSLYGVCDLIAFVKHPHKFESHCLDTLVAPYPEYENMYKARSPINHVDHVDCALCIFQGREDKVILPSQSYLMYVAAKEKNNPVAYKEFEGEHHGFRKAENMKFCLDGEFYFYSRVFNFDASGPDVDLPIENLPDGHEGRE